MGRVFQLAVIACLRYENAIVKPLRVLDAYNLSFLSIFMASSFTLVLYGIVFFVDVFQYDDFCSLSRKALYVLPLYVLCLSLIQVLGNLANKRTRYRSLAFSSVGRS